MTKEFFKTNLGILYHGDVLGILKELSSESIDCIVTSPPYYFLRDYKTEKQIGLEPTLNQYIDKLLEVTYQLKRVLKKTGVMFWVHGDCYGSGKGYDKLYDKYKQEIRNKKPIKGYEKCLLLQNYRLIIRMVDEQGWILRNAIIWCKKIHIHSCAQDRFVNSYEPIFLLVKQKKYWFDLSKFGKHPKDIWLMPTEQSLGGLHPAPFPKHLARQAIVAGCPPSGVVLDPFMGSGTVGVVAEQLGYKWIGIELNLEYCNLAKKRIQEEANQLKLFWRREI